jgi:hypothetical protein
VGTPLGTKLSEAHKAAIASGIRRAIDRGWKPTGSTWRTGLAAITPECRERARAKSVEIMRGRPQRLDTVCGKHANNKAAKYWKFYNRALGKTLEGKNLNQLVRDNAELFEPKDLIWDTCGCNAVRCLRTLKGSKKQTKNHSWKGWMIGVPETSNGEHRES